MRWSVGHDRPNVHNHGVPTDAAAAFMMRPTMAPSASTSKSSSFHSPEGREAEARCWNGAVRPGRDFRGHRLVGHRRRYSRIAHSYISRSDDVVSMRTMKQALRG